MNGKMTREDVVKEAETLVWEAKVKVDTAWAVWARAVEAETLVWEAKVKVDTAWAVWARAVKELGVKNRR